MNWVNGTRICSKQFYSFLWFLPKCYGGVLNSFRKLLQAFQSGTKKHYLVPAFYHTFDSKVLCHRESDISTATSYESVPSCFSILSDVQQYFQELLEVAIKIVKYFYYAHFHVLIGTIFTRICKLIVNFGRK